MSGARALALFQRHFKREAPKGVSFQDAIHWWQVDYAAAADTPVEIQAFGTLPATAGYTSLTKAAQLDWDFICFEMGILFSGTLADYLGVFGTMPSYLQLKIANQSGNKIPAILAGGGGGFTGIDMSDDAAAPVRVDQIQNGIPSGHGFRFREEIPIAASTPFYLSHFTPVYTVAGAAGIKLIYWMRGIDGAPR